MTIDSVEVVQHDYLNGVSEALQQDNLRFPCSYFEFNYYSINCSLRNYVSPLLIIYIIMCI